MNSADKSDEYRKSRAVFDEIHRRLVKLSEEREELYFLTRPLLDFDWSLYPCFMPEELAALLDAFGETSFAFADRHLILELQMPIPGVDASDGAFAGEWGKDFDFTACHILDSLSQGDFNEPDDHILWFGMDVHANAYGYDTNLQCMVDLHGDTKGESVEAWLKRFLTDQLQRDFGVSFR